MVKGSAVVIAGGMNRENSRFCIDVDFEQRKKKTLTQQLSFRRSGATEQHDYVQTRLLL